MAHTDDKENGHECFGVNAMIRAIVITLIAYSLLLTGGLGYEAIQTRLAVNEVRSQESTISQVRIARAADIAEQASRNCAYTSDFVAAFSAWAHGLHNADATAASKQASTPVEREWHESRIKTYHNLFKSLNELGARACPKLSVK